MILRRLANFAKIARGSVLVDGRQVQRVFRLLSCFTSGTDRSLGVFGACGAQIPRVRGHENATTWSWSAPIKGAKRLCHQTRIREPPNSTNSPHTPTVLPPHSTRKEITRADTNIPDKSWNMLPRLLSGHKKLTGTSPRRSRKVGPDARLERKLHWRVDSSF